MKFSFFAGFRNRKGMFSCDSTLCISFCTPGWNFVVRSCTRLHGPPEQMMVDCCGDVQQRSLHVDY